MIKIRLNQKVNLRRPLRRFSECCPATSIKFRTEALSSSSSTLTVNVKSYFSILQKTTEIPPFSKTTLATSNLSLSLFCFPPKFLYFHLLNTFFSRTIFSAPSSDTCFASMVFSHMCSPCAHLSKALALPAHPGELKCGWRRSSVGTWHMQRRAGMSYLFHGSWQHPQSRDSSGWWPRTFSDCTLLWLFL